jgi:arylsulfatase A-like enzyme
LFIVVDDHRADALGALGPATVQTPVLEGLVRRGKAFTRATIQGRLMPAVCAPARACPLTGNGVFRA